MVLRLRPRPDLGEVVLKHANGMFCCAMLRCGSACFVILS